MIFVSSWPVIVSLFVLTGGVYGTQVEPGTHCVNITDSSGTEERCGQCYFPHNCLSSNECLEGSTGYLCERCKHFSSLDQGYFRVGSMCSPCVLFPWALIGLSVFLVLVILNVAYNGLTPSTATKIKQLVDFLQYIVLCVAIKVPWSKVIVKVAVIFQFSYFSPAMATPACILPESLNLYYMEWGATIGLVTFILVFTKLLDKGFNLKLKGDLSMSSLRSVWLKRSQYRRLAYLALMILYVPVTVSAIESFSCTASLFPQSLVLIPSQERFLYDLTVNCDHVLFAAVNNLYTLVLVFYPCFLPIAFTFFILRQRKWSRLQSDIIKYGSLYESYKARCCVWESLVMLRKLNYVLITYTYPISPAFQALGHLSVTGFVFILTIITRPYRKFTWKSKKLTRLSPTMTFELLSMLCILLLEVEGVLKAHEIPSTGLDWTVTALVILTILFWLASFLAVQEERPLPMLLEFEVPLGQKKSDVLPKDPIAVIKEKETTTDEKVQDKIIKHTKIEDETSF